jgi:hypothetical protein
VSETIKPQLLSPEQMEEIVKRHQAATPGRYEWRIDAKSKNVKLLSRSPMMPVVMAFWRWGMGSAAPVFRDAEHDLLRRVEHWVPDRERYPYGPINHPDAQAIAHSWADRDALLSHIAYLTGRAVRLDEFINQQTAKVEQTTAELRSVRAALGQTHQEGIEK